MQQAISGHGLDTAARDPWPRAMGGKESTSIAGEF